MRGRLLIRSVIAVLALTGAFLPGLGAADSPPGASGNLAGLVALPQNAPTAARETAQTQTDGFGHVDRAVFARVPTAGFSAREEPDDIAFTADRTDAVVLVVSGAEVHDQWRWEVLLAGIEHCRGRL